MPNVVLSGWQRPVQKIPLVKLLHARAGQSPSGAKRTVDRILEREPVIVAMPTVASAEMLATAAAQSGVSAMVEVVPV